MFAGHVWTGLQGTENSRGSRHYCPIELIEPMSLGASQRMSQVAERRGNVRDRKNRDLGIRLA